jgi:hypothetical protein
VYTHLYSTSQDYPSPVPDSWLNDTKRKKKTKPPFSAFILRKAEWSPGRTQEEEEGTKESEKARI